MLASKWPQIKQFSESPYHSYWLVCGYKEWLYATPICYVYKMYKCIFSKQKIYKKNTQCCTQTEVIYIVWTNVKYVRPQMYWNCILIEF